MPFTAGYKVNENTDYEFTVSDETIQEMVQGGGITESDIADYCYTALHDSRIYSLHELGQSTAQAGGYDDFIAEYCPYYIPRGTFYPMLNEDMTAKQDVIYERNFLVWRGTIYPGTENAKYGIFLVMDIKDIKKWYMDFNTGCYIQDTVSSTVTKSGVTTATVGYTGDCYYYNDNDVQRAVIKSTSEETVNESLYILNVFILNNEYWVGGLNPSSGGKSKTFEAMNNWNNFTPSYLRGYLDHEDGRISQAGSTDFAGIPKLYGLEFPDARDADVISYPESDNGILLYTRCNRSELPSYSCSYAKDLNTILTWSSWCGLKFKFGDTYYKPIIEQGVIIGYTDDMSVPSEYDDMTNVTGNNISPTPPTPPPTPVDPWDVDPETYGWGGGEVSGMVKYYLLTSGQMSSLQTAIASNANWTIDYLNCVVSCFVVPNSGIFFDAPIPTTVKFVLDNATQWDTGVACSRIQGTKNKSGGTIEIPRLTNTFYDFEPYSDYSVYIPFCGRIPIKGNVCLGREIKVTYYPDVPTCSLTAVVSCGGATIAIAKGSFGTMTPITSNGSDRKTAAVIGDVAPIITGIGTGIVGVALGNPLIVGAGAAQALGGIMGGVKETVQSYAYSVGSSGDSSFFGAGNRCYYYANYPLIDEVVNNSMFGHSVGYLCNTVGKLSGFKGFTICANPHVTFSATSEEREEIERLLSMGVIL